MMSAIKNSQPEQPGFSLADMSPAYFGLVMATRVHRYLPRALPKEVRDYVREAVTAQCRKFPVYG